MTTMTPTRIPTLRRPMASQHRSAQPSKLTPNIDPIRVLRRHLFGIVVSVFFGGMIGVAAFVLLRMWYPLYTAEAVFEIQPGISDSTEFGSRNDLSDDTVARLAETEGQIITSRQMLDKAAQARVVQTQTTWGKQFIDDGVFHKEDAVDELMEDLTAGMIRGTNLFRVTWSSHDAQDVPIVLNTLAEQYLIRRLEDETKIYDKNVDILNSQVAETDSLITRKESEIKEFILSTGLTSVADVRFTAVAQAIETLTDQITTVNASLSMTQTSLEQTQAKLRGAMAFEPEDRYQAENDPLMQSHLSNLLELRTRLGAALEKFEAPHADIPMWEGRIRAAEQQTEAKMHEIIRRNLDAQLRTLQNDVERYRTMLERSELELAEKETKLRDLAAAQAELESKKLRLKHLEQKRESDVELLQQLELLRKRADAASIRLAMRAETPRDASFPQPEIIIPLGSILLTALFVGFVFLREVTDQRVKGASDLSVLPHAHVLGVIPELEEDPTSSKSAEIVVRRHPASVLAESYRQVAAPILREMEHAGHQTLLLLGGLPGAGTTTAVTNLAATSAAGGRRVVVIDANFRRPRLANAMEVDSEAPGLGDLLVQQATIDQAIQHTTYGVDVIGAGTPANRVFERLSMGQFDSILAQLRDRFDLVVIDAPPAVVAGDAMVLANKVDASVLVVRAHQEQRGLIARLMNQLTDARSDLLGIMLNRPRGTAGGYLKKNYAAMARYSESTGS